MIEDESDLVVAPSIYGREELERERKEGERERVLLPQRTQGTEKGGKAPSFLLLLFPRVSSHHYSQVKRGR